MSGSPVYGAGYYKGSQDGFQDGLSKGTGLGAVAALAVVGTVYLGKLGINKLKDVAAARHEKKLLALEPPETPEPNERLDVDNNGDNTDSDVNP
ncbi:hypothetical protein ACHMXB_22575 (plasmid) [Arthrobacter sp. UC242_113]|uniref:hypothetical protein n=1 Tax=Arthrobacter sp. UC242_113 TaxID=3374550 RepID=UPI0037574224